LFLLFSSNESSNGRACFFPDDKTHDTHTQTHTETMENYQKLEKVGEGEYQQLPRLANDADTQTHETAAPAS
jgi:hypothetical protein